MLSNTPVHPPQAVGTPLMPHQRQALSWMCAQENKSSLPPFWEKRGDLYHNVLTCFSSKEVPERVRGGILADDMGLVSNAHLPVKRSLDFVRQSVSLHHKMLLLQSESKPVFHVSQGKTLTTIALILTNFHKGRPLPVEKCVSTTEIILHFVSINLCSNFLSYFVYTRSRSSFHLSRPKRKRSPPPAKKV